MRSTEEELTIDGKTLRRLSRSELLDIIYTLRKNQDTLEHMNADLRAELEARSFKIAQAGSIAEASLAVTKVFDEAQAAADAYLAEVRNSPAFQVQEQSDALLSEVIEQAGAIMNEAEARAQALLSAAEEQASIIIDAAEQQAHEILARAEAGVR